VLADLAARVGAAEQAMQRLAGLETRLGRAEQGAGRVAEIDTRLAKTEKDAARIAELEQRVAKGDGAAARAGPPTRRCSTGLRRLKQRVRRLKPRRRTLRHRPPLRLHAEISMPSRRASPRSSRARRWHRSASPRRRAPTRPGAWRSSPSSLRAAVERGEPFARELAAAQPLADAKLLGALEPFAATGVPRSAALSRELSQLSGAMLNAAGRRRARGGFIDRLQQNAERLVRIRPINEAPGDDAATVITRADVKAANGDIMGALAEVKSLPAAVSAPAQGWIRKAEGHGCGACGGAQPRGGRGRRAGETMSEHA
jgi:hypothetical protein